MNAEVPLLAPSLAAPSPPVAIAAGLRDLLPDPRDIWAVFRRNLGLFVLVLILAMGGTLLWALYQTPIYVAKSSLMVQPHGDIVVDVKSVTPEVPASADVVDTRVRLVTSPAVTRLVAEAYAERHPAERPENEAGMRALAARLVGMVKVARSGSTYLIDITASSSDPAQAAEVVNLFAEKFVENDKTSKVVANENADRWLRKRSKELEADATAADQSLQSYKIRHGLLSANGRSGAENQIANLDSEIAQAEADLAEKSGRLAAAREQLRSGSGGADVGAALGSGTIGSLRKNEAELSAKVAQLQSMLGPRHPDLVRARNELVAVRSQIQLEIDRILSNLSAESHVASSRLASLQASRGRSHAVLATNNAAQVGLDELQRRADAAQAIYETFLNRSRETTAQQGLQQADTRVAALAEIPDSPDFPNWKLAGTFAVVTGLALGFLAIGLAEYLAGGVRTKLDIEQRLQVPYAGAIPLLPSIQGRRTSTEAPQDYLVAHPFSSFAESFRSLRTFLMLGGGAIAGEPRTIGIVSALPQEGKTTSAICLARTFAMGGASTILVDCDLRRRSASQLLLEPETSGIVGYLEGESTLDQAIRIDEATGLAVLGTTLSKKPGDALSAERLARLFHDLKRRYNIVIIDTPPVLGVADARTVAASADCVLMVTLWRNSSFKACEAAIEMLSDAGVILKGAALSKVDVRRYASTSHSDNYSYRKKFKPYYIE